MLSVIIFAAVPEPLLFVRVRLPYNGKAYMVCVLAFPALYSTVLFTLVVTVLKFAGKLLPASPPVVPVSFRVAVPSSVIFPPDAVRFKVLLNWLMSRSLLNSHLMRRLQ